VLVEEDLGLGVASRRRDDVRADGAPAAGVLAHGASPDRDTTDRRPTESGATHGEAADREQDPEGEAAQAREAQGEAPDRDPARREPADRDEPRRDVADRDHPPRVAAHLPLLEVGAEGDRHERDVADRDRTAVAHAPGPPALKHADLLLELADTLLEIALAGHGTTSAERRP
jgi:hypothetical protein